LKKLIFSSLFTLSLFASTVDRHTPHWGYLGDISDEYDIILPKDWGEVAKLCGEGKSQSPIDIKTSETKPAGDKSVLKFFKYKTSVDGKVINNGHTIKISPEFLNSYDNSYITVDGKFYQLLQFHMHTHSESTIDGKRFDLVAHLVHKSYDGELAVVGIFFEEGEENFDIKKYWDFMPKKRGEKNDLEDLDISHILPTDTSGYYSFMGSLTTPPCTEGVKWFILKDTLQLSKAQIGQLRAIFPHNYRDLQETNGRDIWER
jgi:carbonic anhydrase